MDLCDSVYRVVCDLEGPGNRVLTGFRTTVQEVTGIATALHGVVGCEGIVADNLTHSHPNLEVVMVNVARDVALLSSDEVQADDDPGLLIGDQFLETGLRVVGHPEGILGQISFPLELFEPPLNPLYLTLNPKAYDILSDRGSPHPDSVVLRLRPNISRGHSGGPILTDEGKAIAVANGGIGKNIGWAIPLWLVEWEPYVSSLHAEFVDPPPATQPNTELEQLYGVVTAPFGGDILFTNGNEQEGVIYRFADGDITEVYRRPFGRIHSIAVGPDQGLYFSDHNDNFLYRVSNGEEVQVHSHSTYLRDVGFDADGNLHFSESSGGSGDGAIYRIEGGEAVLAFQVRVADVNGFWAGNFAFGPEGNLWLSNGNRRPSQLFRVSDESTRPVFRISGTIRGFSFAGDTRVLFADGELGVTSLSIPDFGASSFFSSGGEFQITDVEPVLGSLIPEPVAPAPELYFTDARQATGTIYHLEEGIVSEHYQRPSGRIYSLAMDPNGILYFSDANDPHVYRLTDGQEELVFTHSTYLRDIAFDPQGRLHFSEASGSAADGTIYRLDGGQPTLYTRVELSEVDGSWAGDFDFAPDGSLWLSSGNRSPAYLYKVVDSLPRQVFSSASPITGFSFSPDGEVYYADWRSSLHRLSLSSLDEVVYSGEGDRWLSDVVLIGPS